MAAFLGTQLDFIYFFYGLAFILLGTTCAAIARRAGGTESWAVLALFGFFHGAGEWLDLTALIIGDTVAFGVLRVTIMTASFVFLAEFARREAIRFGLKVPGRWLFIPLLSLVAIAGAIDGINAAGAIARYAIGFLGAMSTSLVFVRYSKGFSGTTARLAMCAAGGFAFYAFAAGAIVPAAQFWPASAFDQEWFYHVTGIPIQLVRGVVACWIAFSIWAIWGQQLVTDLSSADYTRFQRRQFIWTLVTMAAILVAGWTLTELLGNIYMDNVQRDSRGDIDLLASRLTVETETVDGMARALAGSPSVLPLLAGGGLRDWQRGKAVLDLDVEAFGAAAGYILDRSGAPVVSSERPEHTGSSAVNFRSSLLFQTSIAGGAGHLFAFDPRNGARDYYASAPIRAEGGAIVGVAVLKKSLDRFGTDVMRLDRPYFFIDPEGVVVLTNRPNLLFHALWPLSADALAAVAQKFGVIPGGPMMGREVTDATWIDVDGERDFVRRRFVDHSRWSLVILKPTQEIYATRILGIVITLLMAITTLIYLFGKERWVHDTIQLGKRLKLQELARDLRFQATTDPLTGLCNRLKFDQALANEVSRSARYQIPLSLVFYDIDHFKQINDAHGHQTGDKVLIQVSKLVADNIRGTDLLARWGGEEFIIMFPACDGRTACHAAEKLRLAIAQAVFEGVGAVTCSFGVAQHVEGTNADTLVARADRALYRAKINGRNRVELASADPLASVA